MFGLKVNVFPNRSSRDNPSLAPADVIAEAISPPPYSGLSRQFPCISCRHVWDD